MDTCFYMNVRIYSNYRLKSPVEYYRSALQLEGLLTNTYYTVTVYCIIYQSWLLTSLLGDTVSTTFRLLINLSI